MDFCLFCKIVAHEIPATILYEDEYTIAFLDINPVKPGHTLVVPKVHAADFRESQIQDLIQVLEVAKKIASGILKTVGAQGFNFSSNVGTAAGQVIFHTHFHLIPRHDGDGLVNWPHDGATREELVELGNHIRVNLQSSEPVEL